MKRKVLMTLGIGFLCSMMPMTAFATEALSEITAIEELQIVPEVAEVTEEKVYVLTATEAGFEYSVDEAGNATITAYTGGAADVTIPGTLGGYPVTTIGYKVFCQNTTLESVVIPEGVTYIDTWAFNKCTKLKNVSLPSTLESMGNVVFGDCTALESIAIPKNLWDAGSTPFSGCTALKTITFEEGCYRIPSNLFSSFAGLESFVVPDTITSIGKSAFYNCKNLKEITIPDSVKNIEGYAFKGCTALSKVNLSDSIRSIEQYAFQSCSKLESIKLPAKLKTLGGLAFSESGLKEIVLPDSLTEIQMATFAQCTSLTRVTLGAGITKIGNSAFKDCTALSSIQMNDKVTTIVRDAFFNCDSLTSITLPNSINDLGYTLAFGNCDKLSSVILSNGITVLPRETFKSCTALQKIILPYRVTTIYSGAFSDCAALTEVTIPRSVKKMDNNVFSNPEKLTIYGVAGTYAEEYAASIGAKFVAHTVNATSITFGQNALTIKQEETITPIANILPLDFTDEVTWTSSNPAVATVDANGLVKGIEQGTVTITVKAGAVSDSCQVTVQKKVKLADVHDYQWEYTHAYYVYERGLMTGIGFDTNGDVLFSPKKSLPREQFAQVLYSAEGKDAVNYTARFGDVPDGQWYTSAVLWAADKGIVSGYENGNFGVGDPITREQLALMLYKFAEYRGYDTRARAALTKFEDEANVSSWAREQMQWAVANGIISGKTGNLLDPKGTATRGECAAMLRTFMMTFEEGQTE